MKKILLVLLFISVSAFSQKEANNWFFGSKAGIHFLEDGSVEPLTGSQMVTNEGCSSISDANGNLLFYTDGRNVWDKNHIIMPNANYFAGTGLLGDPSSTNSAIIIPKKGNPNIYYIFTVDEPHHQNAAVYPNQFDGVYTDTNPGMGVPEADDGFNNGLNYSVVDLSVTGSNGSVGDVIDRNIHLVTYNPNDIEQAKYKCSEKITAVKSENGTGFWVLTQFVDTFYAFFVDENGVNTTPVTTQITPLVPTSGYRRNAIGCLKASPNAKYVAIAHNQLGTLTGENSNNGTVYLYDFNNATGILSNAIQIKNNCQPYGVEFSAKSEKLYISFEFENGYGGLHQFDMLSTNIPGSDEFIGNVTGTALQLGPNEKIYSSVNGGTSISVINAPEENGANCNFSPNSILLPPGSISVFGLPPFITSFFTANIVAQNVCLGDTTQFELNTSNDFETIVWDFGDGSPTSTELAPLHTYSTAGTYTVVATIEHNTETTVIEEEITIYTVPVAHTPAELTECDPDNDGKSTFNLTANNALILDTQNTNDFEIRYFASQQNADNNIQALSATAYVNTSNPQTIYARIYNKAGTTCYDTASFTIKTIQAPEILTHDFALCDDDTDGDDTNGRISFNMDNVTASLLQNPADYTVAYYATQSNALTSTAPLSQSYYNTTPGGEVVYAHILNNNFTECYTIEPINLIVNALPDPVQNVALTQCDIELNADGITQFNLMQADNYFTNGNAGLTVSYFEDEANALDSLNVVTGAYTNLSNPQTVYARVSNTTTGCYRVLPLTLQVNTNTVTGVTLEVCDDDGTEDGYAAFTLTDAGLETPDNSVVYYSTVEDALLEVNPVDSEYTNTVAYNDTVYARVENNNECTAIQEIALVVHRLPDISYYETAIVCVNTSDYIVLDAGTGGNNFTYLWSTGATTRRIQVNEPGEYSVLVTDTSFTTLCQKTKTITVLPGDVAVIDDILVHDLSDNNTLTVLVSPASDVDTVYMYSLDDANGPWKRGNYFENVAPGVHTVYVYDTNGCGIVKKDVAVLGIPNYFTPNADGSHDYWNITGINGWQNYNSKIYIFDRYGKLIADVKPQSPGWDGTYNGRPLPSDDYWYLIKLQDGRILRGHFSMVR